MSYARTPDRNVDASVNALSAWVSSPYRGGPAGCAAMLSLETRSPAPRSSFFFLIAGDMLTAGVASRVTTDHGLSFRGSDVNSGQTVEIKFGVPQVHADRIPHHPCSQPRKVGRARHTRRHRPGQDIEHSLSPCCCELVFDIPYSTYSGYPLALFDISVPFVRLVFIYPTLYTRRTPRLARDIAHQEVLTHPRHLYQPRTSPKCLPQ